MSASARSELPLPRPLRLRPRAALDELCRAANAGRRPEDLLARGLSVLLAVTRLPAGIACLDGSADAGPAVRATAGLRPSAARALERGYALAAPGRVCRHPVPDLPVPAAMRELLGGEGFTQAIVVPLVAEHGPVGTLLGLGRATAAIRASPGILGAIARDLGTAVDNAQVRQRLERANGDLLRLLTLVKILAEPRSLEDTLTTVAQAARAFTRAMMVTVWLANPETQRLHRIVAIGPPGRWRREQPRILPYGQDVAGWIAEHVEPAHLDDALADARLGDPAWARERGVSSVYGFPLRFLDRLVGVLSVGTETPLTGPRASLLEAYSDHAALAIGQADLRRQLEAR